MVNQDALIDNIVAVLRSNVALVATLDSADPNNIVPYYHDDAFSTNFEGAIQEQVKGSIMVAWRGTRTGNFAKNEATQHDFIAIMKMVGRASLMTDPFWNGICTVRFDVSGQQSNNFSFRKTTVHPKCNPPTQINVVPQPIFISAGYGLYDTVPATFIMVEKGLDV